MAYRDHTKGCRVSCLLNLHGAPMRRQDTRAKTVQLYWLSQDLNQIWFQIVFFITMRGTLAFTRSVSL